MKKFFLSFLMVVVLSLSSTPFTIKIFKTQDMEPLFPFVASQLLTTFKDYPYLYDGNYNEVMGYLGWFATLPYSTLAIAYHDNQPVGFLTGTSFIDFDKHLNGSIEAFNNAQINPEAYYYFAECIVMPEHRNKSLSTKLFKTLEEEARSQGFSHYCLVTESHDNHPLKPDNYNSLDPIWKKLGYNKSSITLPWRWATFQPDGTTRMQEHALTYWLK
jgi:GNAT superfamily N-acetyltransferase